MFERLNSEQERAVTFTFEGKTIEAHEGDTVAAALIAAGYRCFSNIAGSNSKLHPFCMMGSCYGCIVCVDGCNVQSCMVECKQGLDVRRVVNIYNENDV